MLTEANRHAGHADILREQLDGATGESPNLEVEEGHDAAFWEEPPFLDRAGRAGR